MQTILFAGRRSSDRVFLLLQNIFCAKHLKGYAGTSAVYAVTKVDAALQQLGIADLSERRKFIGQYMPCTANRLHVFHCHTLCMPRIAAAAAHCMFM